MTNESSGGDDCEVCGGSGVIISDGVDAKGERTDAVENCECCQPGRDDDREIDEVDRPAMVLSYDERPFDGDRDFADLDGVRW